MAGYRYASDFFDFVDATARRSASRFLERLDLGFSPRHVLDVGCGRGVWLAAWKALGAETVVGVDGAYVDPESLHISPSEFRAADLSSPLDLGRRFDLVQCLEVAEHLAEAASETLLSSLVRHGDVVLFAAATPGQGGEHHVNERPIAHWVERFRAMGFDAYDCLRPAMRGERRIEPWYRYNALLYASPRGAERLSDAVRRTVVRPGTPLRQYASLWWRARCAMVRRLSPAAVHWLARLKHRAVAVRRPPDPGARPPRQNRTKTARSGIRKQR